jgi:hypothetical protein
MSYRCAAVIGDPPGATPPRRDPSAGTVMSANLPHARASRRHSPRRFVSYRRPVGAQRSSPRCHHPHSGVASCIPVVRSLATTGCERRSPHSHRIFARSIQPWLGSSFAKSLEKKHEPVPPGWAIRLETWLLLTVLDRFGLDHGIMGVPLVNPVAGAPAQPSLIGEWIHRASFPTEPRILSSRARGVTRRHNRRGQAGGERPRG